jgi:hypothetical protein
MPKPNQIFPEGESRWLSNDAVIWRYVPLRTLFFYLNGQVFIPSVAKLRGGDPFEGEFYEDITWFNDAFCKHYKGEAKAVDEWMKEKLCSDLDRKFIELNKNNPNTANAEAGVLRKHYFDFVRRTRFAWCWFHSNHESAAMWSVYGNQGVAIKSTIGKLSALFETTGREFIYGRMTYVDYQKNGISTDFDPPADFNLLLRPFFVKRKEFESEKEVRFVTAENGYDERGGVLLKDLKPQDWISAIRLWPELNSEEANSILKIVKHFVLEVDCQKSDLLSDPDAGLPEFNDAFGPVGDSAAQSNWTKKQDGIPASLKVL